MKIFLLRIVQRVPYYDCYDGKVIRAKDSIQARKIANEEYADEGKIWEDSSLVSRTRIKEAGLPQVIMTDFHAG